MLKDIIVASFLSITLLPTLAIGEETLPTIPQDQMAAGPFQPTDESLRTYKYPEWFRDAKLGFWAHWGPQAVPRRGDWYARRMYESDQIDEKTGAHLGASDQYKFHVEHYGHPSKFGYKDIIPLWKAEKFDPVKLIALYKKAGAKYFVSMGVHHDNFFLWNSAFHHWNSVEMGPHRDVVGEWQKAARAAGLRFGISEHIARSSMWYGAAHKSDPTGPLAGVPYDGNDPVNQSLYGPSPIEGDTGWTSKSAQGQLHWQKALTEIITKYKPDLIYSDSDLPFENNRLLGRQMLANFYNTNLANHKGSLEAVYNAKTESNGAFVRDIERGVADKIESYPWQTDTSIGDWYYGTGQHYKSVTEVIQMLTDIVSKNGNLLINIVQTPEGDLEPDVVAIVDGIGTWTAANGEAIYGSRPWKIYGEGPSTVAKAQEATYNEGKTSYSAQDIRFTTKGKVLYAMLLDTPTEDIRITSLGKDAKLAERNVASVSLLGMTEPLKWKQEGDALVITKPTKLPAWQVLAFKITFGK